MGLFCFRYLNLWFKAIYMIQHIKSLIPQMAGGYMAASLICSRDRLREGFPDGSTLYMAAGVFHPVESGKP